MRRSVTSLLEAGKLKASEVRAIGAHGQTVRHRPDLGYTVQLNAPALLAELTGIDVVADFRSRDVAAGGQGAPLVPAFHRIVFGSDRPRAVVNIGGIGNVTALEGERVMGFDAGPGNVLIDGWMAAHFDAAFDAGGALAATSLPDEELVDTLMSDALLRRGPAEEHGQGSVHARLGAPRRACAAARRQGRARLADGTHRALDRRRDRALGTGGRGCRCLRRRRAQLDVDAIAATSARRIASRADRRRVGCRR